MSNPTSNVDYKGIFIDASEEFRAELGDTCLLHDDKRGKKEPKNAGIAVLSDRRLYLKGTFSKRRFGKRFFGSTVENRAVEVSHIVGTNIIRANKQEKMRFYVGVLLGLFGLATTALAIVNGYAWNSIARAELPLLYWAGFIAFVIMLIMAPLTPDPNDVYLEIIFKDGERLAVKAPMPFKGMSHQLRDAPEIFRGAIAQVQQDVKGEGGAQ